MNPAPHDEMDPQAAFIAGHEDAKARLGAEPFDASDAHGRQVVYALTDSRDDVNAMLAAAGLRSVTGPAVWCRFYLADLSGGLLLVLHNGTKPGSLELLVAGNSGVVTRPLLRAAATWAFVLCGAQRLTLYTAAADRKAGDYARRAGFRHEGTLRDYYGPEADASLWGLLRAECPWLTPAQRGPLALAPATPATVQ